MRVTRLTLPESERRWRSIAARLPGDDPRPRPDCRAGALHRGCAPSRTGAPRYGEVVSDRLRRSGTAWPAALLLVAMTAAVGCARMPRPVTAAGPQLRSPEVPVVLVPGITGSKLRDRRTGEVVWGEASDLLCPRDGGYNLAVPLRGEPRLEAFEVIEEIRLGPARQGIYAPLIDALEARGYRQGRLQAPADAGASLYAFAYDWRLSVVGAAGELAGALEELRRARGEAVLEVDLICQSSGGHVCRWLAKYGGATLAEAEAGGPAPPQGVRVRRVVLVASANGGSLRVLHQLDRGRRYLKPFGRRMRPEVLFTLPALYEDLPHRADGLLLDTSGKPLPAEESDLYDPETWRRLGWSVFGEETSRRIEMAGRTDLFGTDADRIAFLRRMLQRARRVQGLLAADPPGFDEAVQYLLLGNPYDDTPLRAVVVPTGRGFRTLYPGDRALEKMPYLKARATAPGDGHATVQSLLDLSPAERALVAADPFWVPGGHFRLILEPAAHRRIAEFLLK